MVWDIALGIVLGYILIACLPLIIGGGIMLIGLAIAAAIVIAAFIFLQNNPAFFGALVLCAFIIFIVFALREALKKFFKLLDQCSQNNDYAPIIKPLTNIWTIFCFIVFLPFLATFIASLSILNGDTGYSDIKTAFILGAICLTTGYFSVGKTVNLFFKLVMECHRKKDYSPLTKPLNGIWNVFQVFIFLASLLFFTASLSNLLHGDTRYSSIIIVFISGAVFLWTGCYSVPFFKKTIAGAFNAGTFKIDSSVLHPNEARIAKIFLIGCGSVVFIIFSLAVATHF